MAGRNRALIISIGAARAGTPTGFMNTDAGPFERDGVEGRGRRPGDRHDPDRPCHWHPAGESTRPVGNRSGIHPKAIDTLGTNAHVESHATQTAPGRGHPEMVARPRYSVLKNESVNPMPSSEEQPPERVPGTPDGEQRAHERVGQHHRCRDEEQDRRRSIGEGVGAGQDQGGERERHHPQGQGEEEQRQPRGPRRGPRTSGRRRRHQCAPRSQTAMPVGRSAPLTVRTTSSSTAVSSTSPRSRVANPRSVVSASTRARSNRRSTARWTPPAEGLEQGERDQRGGSDGEGVLPGHRGEQRLEDDDARRRRRATRTAVTTAQPMVRLMMWSIAYSR